MSHDVFVIPFSSIFTLCVSVFPPVDIFASLQASNVLNQEINVAANMIAFQDRLDAKNAAVTRGALARSKLDCCLRLGGS